MIGWLYRMIVGRFSACKHQWKIHTEIKIYWEDSDTMPSARRYVLRCEKCGEMTSRRFK